MGYTRVAEWSDGRAIATIVKEMPPLPPPPPGVSGLIKDLQFWNGAWQGSVPVIVIGNTVGIKAVGQNTGYILDSMTVNAVIYDPDGNTIASETQSMNWVGVEAELGIECTTSKSKEGKHTVHLELIGIYDGAGYVLDEWDGDIALESGGKGEIPWKWLGIGGVALASVLLLKPEKTKRA